MPVHVARPAPRARRVHGAVRRGHVDAHGHRVARPPVIPGHAAHRPPDARDVRPAAGQRPGAGAHQSCPVVPRRRRAMAEAAERHGVRQHAPLGGTGQTARPERPGNRRHTPTAAKAHTPGELICFVDFLRTREP